MRPGTLIEIKAYSPKTYLEREVELYSQVTSPLRSLTGQLPLHAWSAKSRCADAGNLASPLPANRSLDRSRVTAKIASHH